MWDNYIINAAILFSSIYLIAQISTVPFSGSSSTSRKIWIGILLGILGLILMRFSFKVSPIHL